MTCLGFWVLAGIISFVICEKLVSFNFDPEDSNETNYLEDSSSCNNNLEHKKTSSTNEFGKKASNKHVS